MNQKKIILYEIFVLDINECTSKGSNGCSQNCHNTIGSYTCSCNKGYRLNQDQQKCDGKSMKFELYISVLHNDL